MKDLQYILDTDICIYIIKHKPASVFERFRRCAVGEIGISSITYSELCHGVAKSANPSKNRSALNGFVAPLEILPYGEQESPDYGELRAELEAGGIVIGPLDMLIASHARSNGLTLVTNNAKEFSRVPRLKIENWV